MKKINIFLVVISLLFLGACQKKEVVVVKEKSFDYSPIIYVQAGCYHCQVTEAYLQQKGIKDSLTIKDLRRDSGTYEQAMVTAEFCQIKENDFGTPFFFDGQKCYLGSEEIINYFEEKLR